MGLVLKRKQNKECECLNRGVGAQCPVPYDEAPLKINIVRGGDDEF